MSLAIIDLDFNLIILSLYENKSEVDINNFINNINN